ncbi:hypothetical protein SOVF_204530 [Spinacia oleracea]|uniref:Uncharacterized protein LOC110799781 n=1 Tax=Spinacia oleracea TaxID=3562 RepID=A0A9R0J3K2_SPIOL|nr:uncharacterized protein LOC110799781 [Spinacia oleracea]XP_021860742.1 uncharacterized protein LOC110799781 [Spinacia oleracea]XP_021860743.1 uncharacterized protein LOC110799781 [Spinacia oleracea]KNA03931.1 hypothetical protein SOVF_204530 [Spinacia oleracea]
MEAEDTIQLPSCGDSDNEIHGDEADKKVGIQDGVNLVQSMEGDAEIEEGQLILKTAEITGEIIETTETGVSGFLALRCENDGQIEEGQLVSDENGAVGEEIVTETERNYVIKPPENGCVIEQNFSNSCPQTNVGSISGVKRKRVTSDEQQPSVHVKYSCLSRQSKLKLEEVLREWSEWHVQKLSGNIDQYGGSETGEGTYFPALDIGTERTSVVSFWIENEIRKPDNEDFMPVEDSSVPLYDRGFALGSISSDGLSNLEGGLELLDAPRCFNCGSYSHSLKECSKPRNNAAVNNSRKQLKSKRNQTAGMRNPARYYQDSPGGKYQGLKPGVLNEETRRLLGLGEFDPPPWLNRMREIGYPPGYLELEDEDVPSGITIFADEEIKEDKEEGEILEAEVVETPQKKSVEFPGMNAPIPNDADERVWAARPSNSDRHRNGGGFHSESYNRGRHREHNNRDFKDNDSFDFDRGPSRYTQRYGDHDFSPPSHSSRKNVPAPRSPNSGRSTADRGRNDNPDSEDPLANRLYSSYSYNSSRRFSDHNNDSDGSRGDQPDYSSRGSNREDKYRHRSGR